MKNTKSNFSKAKLAARVMLCIILFSVLLNLTGCGFTITMAEAFYTHENFVKMIEKYNSINNGSVDTFISFDLDSNENISESLYVFSLITNHKGLVQKYGFLDIYDDFYDVTQEFYLNENAQKITIRYSRIPNNFTEEDKIEIILGGSHFSCVQSDSYYFGSNSDGSNEEYNRIYDYAYRYIIVVNDVEIGCIHISSIEKASEEKLAEIIQMMQDSLVVLNTEEFFVWRKNK